MIDKISVMNRARIHKRRARDLAVKQIAGEEFEEYKGEPFFLSGVMLYWAEGTRLSKKYRKYQLAFTNSDPNLISFYAGFLRKYFKNIEVGLWRVGLFLYPDIDNWKAVRYWADILNISESQFIKPQILRSNNSSDKRLTFGTCCVYVNSKDACLTMQVWIDAVGGII